MDSDNYWWIIPAVTGMVKSGIDAYTGYKKGQSAERGRLLRNKQIDDLSKITPAERDYVKRQKEISEFGDKNIDAVYDTQRTRAHSSIVQAGSQFRQKMVGQAISQGLENSIVAQELRSRADKDTLKNISETSSKIAEANAMAQLQANVLEQQVVDSLILDAELQSKKYGYDEVLQQGEAG